MRFFGSLAAMLLLLNLAGCAGLPEADETAKWTAAEFYDAAKTALKDGDYQTAIDLFGKLEARYPYGRYAEQAQLETAYAHYKAGEPTAAIAAADRFVKLHPRHPNVDYAYYIRGLASFDQGRSILDKIVTNDPARQSPEPAREAFRYFKELVTRFPNSRYTEDAIQRMTYLRNSLARYEVNVADYYFRREAYLAALNRAQYVVDNYARTPAVADALALMIESYRKMQMNELAADTLRVLKQNFPDHPLVRTPAAAPATNNNGS